MARDMILYVAVIGIIILLKLFYTSSSTDELILLLAPINLLVEVLTGQISVYTQNYGFYFDEMKVAIDKSCAGFNLYVMSFAMFSFLLIGYTHKTKHWYVAPLVGSILAYVFTIFSNTSRIYSSIIINDSLVGIGEMQGEIIHQSIGIITNLSFLILAYYITDNILKIKYKNEKSS